MNINYINKLRNDSELFYELHYKYFGAADYLIRNEGAMILSEKYEYLPVLFLYRHSIELILKCNIIDYILNNYSHVIIEKDKYIVYDGNKFNLYKNHSLKSLYQQFKSFYKDQQFKKYFENSLDKTIDLINKLDVNGTSFRYFDNVKNDQILSEYFGQANKDTVQMYKRKTVDTLELANYKIIDHDLLNFLKTIFNSLVFLKSYNSFWQKWFNEFNIKQGITASQE